MVSQMSESQKKPDNGKILNYTAIGISILVLIGFIGSNAMSQTNTQSEKIISLEKTMNSMNETLTKLNNTNINIIKYINDRNEPFMQNVINFVNQTQQRLDKLEK